jgi:serine/threonine protein phosphatase PrpC
VTRRPHYDYCGHLPGLLLRADGRVEHLDSTDTVVGLFPSWESAMTEPQLLPGDTFALYTDGITEACNDQGRSFGERRLVDTLQRYRTRTASEIVSAVFDAVREFSRSKQGDDFTLSWPNAMTNVKKQVDDSRRSQPRPLDLATASSSVTAAKQKCRVGRVSGSTAPPGAPY